MGTEAIPPIRFADCRGSRIAWQAWGSGPDVIAIPPAAQNIEVAWDWPPLRAMFERFGSFCHYVHFDKRGTGSSDRTVRVPHVDDRVDDLKAVMDDAGVERAHLFAQSEGGVTALLFAAAYPHRVDSLVLLGTAARLVSEDLTPELRAEQVQRRDDFARAWGTPDSQAVQLFAPSRLDDRPFREWFSRYERLAASYESLRDLLIQMIDMDARAVVGDIEAPMLVMSRTGDLAMPIESARELADLARDATFIELDGIDHFAFLGDIEQWMVPFERWVTGTVRERPLTRAPSQVHVTTMGRFVVSADGHDVPTGEWGSRRARTLLKRLVVANGWPVTRDELFDLLWPDEADRSTLGARLSVQLSHVRRVLGGGVLADRDTVALDRAHVSTDLEEALRSTDDARIIELVGGEFLPDDRYEDWCAPMREQVRSILVGSLRRRLDDLDAPDRPDRSDGPDHTGGSDADADRERARLRRRLAELDEPVDH